MRWGRVRLYIWIMLFGGIIVAALAIIVVSGRLLARTERGADPAAALNIIPNKPPDWPVELVWLPDGTDTGRIPDPFTRTQIEAAYVRAWLQLTIAHQQGQPVGLKTYFMSPALDAIEQQFTSDTNIQQVTTRHELELHFFSADGSLIIFTDHAATITQIIRDLEGNVIHVNETVGTYDVVMFQDDGLWKVRHWQRTNIVQTEPPTREPLPLVRGINYYPADTPWDLFWTTYNREIVTKDLEQIRDLNLDTIRIFIPYEQFGADEVDHDLMLNVRDFMNRADRASLRVIVTLFDFRGEYGLLAWPAADRHAETIVSELADHPALFAWDIKNEPDLDYDIADPAIVNAWLAHMAQLIRRFDSDARVTVGWSSAEAAATLADELDFVSFHYFERSADFPDAYARLREKTDVPIVITEFGMTTWNPLFFPFGRTDGEQARHYQQLVNAINDSDARGYMAWTLHDFTHLPNSVAGRLPWRKNPQAHMGILNTDGELKLAGQVLSAENVAPIPRNSLGWTMQKPFTWIAVVSLFSFYIIVRRRLDKDL